MNWVVYSIIMVLYIWFRVFVAGIVGFLYLGMRSGLGFEVAWDQYLFVIISGIVYIVFPLIRKPKPPKTKKKPINLNNSKS